MRGNRHVVAALITGMAVGAFGCAPAEEGPQSTPTEQADDSLTGSRLGDVPMMSLELTSSAFDHEGSIPVEHTCDGRDVSPALAWTPGPEGTQSYALIMDDPDAPVGLWVHWVMWNIPGPRLGAEIPPDDELLDGTRQGTNSWGRLGYGGPCPPSGTHRYFFKVFALDTTLDLPPSTTNTDLLNALQDHVLARGELMGRYARRR